jgi:bacteriophage N4 adsorption protein B
MIWRGGFRFLFVYRHYGTQEGLRSLPRMFVASFVAIASARRAFGMYVDHLRNGHLKWDKTAHIFPKRKAD